MCVSVRPSVCLSVCAQGTQLGVTTTKKALFRSLFGYLAVHFFVIDACFELNLMFRVVEFDVL